MPDDAGDTGSTGSSSIVAGIMTDGAGRTTCRKSCIDMNDRSPPPVPTPGRPIGAAGASECVDGVIVDVGEDGCIVPCSLTLSSA